MAIFSVNQNKQLYVVKKVEDPTSKDAKAGSGKIVKQGNDFYLLYKNALGTLTRSDIVDKDKVMSVTFKSTDDLARPLKETKIVLKEDSTVISGQDYILRIKIRQYPTPSDTQWTIKHGAVHGTVGMEASEFYARLAASIFLNMKREIQPLIKVTLDGKGEITNVTGMGDNTKITYVNTEGDATTVSCSKLEGATSVTLEEIQQPWALGTRSIEPVFFEVSQSPITYLGDDIDWATITEGFSATDKVNGSYKLADLEYFAMGERGDQYRQIGWPDYVPTKYLIEPSDDAKYDIVNIHYYWHGNNEAVSRSEKDMVIVLEEDQVEAFKTSLGYTEKKPTEVAKQLTTQTIDSEGKVSIGDIVGND